jgi:hypothetical protein
VGDRGGWNMFGSDSALMQTEKAYVHSPGRSIARIHANSDFWSSTSDFTLRIVTFLSQSFRDIKRIEIQGFPAGHFGACLMDLPMMATVKRTRLKPEIRWVSSGRSELTERLIDMLSSTIGCLW